MGVDLFADVMGSLEMQIRSIFSNLLTPVEMDQMSFPAIQLPNPGDAADPDPALPHWEIAMTSRH